MNQSIDLSKLMVNVSDTRKPFVIVGGGIAGVYAALLLQDLCPHQKIIIIEQSASLGGLLGSRQFHGHWFDYGTHVPRETGLAHIDELLFSYMQEKGFSSFRNSNAANISKDNCLYTRSPNPFLATPSNTSISLQLDEIKKSNQHGEFENLDAQLRQVYGDSLTEDFFAPCMKKRFGARLNELAPNSHQLVGLSRLILGNADLMETLKKQPSYDKVLAFADQTMGMSKLNHYYPLDGDGVGKWIDGLVDSLDETNVSIFCQANVTGVSVENEQIESISFVDHTGYKQTIDCEQLFWCGPVFPLLKLSKSSYKPSYRPTIRQTYLYHFAFEQPPIIESNYVNVNDPKFSSFRITLYSNLCNTPTDTHRITVEVIADKSVDSIPDCESIYQELIQMRIIEQDNPLKFAVNDTVTAGFPVLTVGFMQETKKQSSVALAHMTNLSLLGKANGKSFFMHDVLVNAHDQICALVE